MSAPSYYPAEGTAIFNAVELVRQEPGKEISSATLARVLGCDTKQVMAKLARAVDAGLLTKRRVGNSSFYGWGSEKTAKVNADAPRLQADHNAIARMAVIKLKGTMLGSVDLAIACNTTPDVIDAALAPLVDAHKLSRISVLRGGVAMFDYRYSAAWVPKDADFEFQAPGAAPHPSLSAVAPPASKPVAAPKKPAPVPPVTNPASPWHKDGPSNRKPAVVPHDALAAGAELGRKIGLPEDKAQDAAAFLGWQLHQAGQLDDATLDAATSTETIPNVMEASYMVMAMNSRGEFVIDLGGGDLVKFPPSQALSLKRFLDNTSVLEELAGQGAL